MLSDQLISQPSAQQRFGPCQQRDTTRGSAEVDLEKSAAKSIKRLLAYKENALNDYFQTGFFYWLSKQIVPPQTHPIGCCVGLVGMFS